MTIRERIDHAKQRIKGKVNQAADQAHGDKEQKAREQSQELKGDLGEVGSDIKESFKDR